MAESAPGRVTYQDVLDAPEHLKAEIIAGELHLTPTPGYPHQRAASEAGADVLLRFARSGSGGPGGWVILDEPELHLGGSEPTSVVLVPDLAGWRKERFAPPSEHGHTLAPDWVCEVLSPGARNARRDRMLKPEHYHQAGVGWMWLIDPVARMVETYRREVEGYLRVGVFQGFTEARIPPFEAVAFDMSAWWVGEPEDGA